MKPRVENAIESALRTLKVESQGLAALEKAMRANGLGGAFERAVATVFQAAGRVIVTGMGKSGHVARKIAATLASTGQPAMFVHPAEARERPRAPGGHMPRASRRAGGLRHRARADDVDDDAARAGRRARDRAA